MDKSSKRWLEMPKKGWVAGGFHSSRGDKWVEGMLSPGVCGSSQLVPMVGMMCGVIQTATAVLAKTLREGAAKE